MLYVVMTMLIIHHDKINILKALGEPLPQYAHVPIIMGTDGERLSKRHGAVSVLQYYNDGYLPEALINLSGKTRLVAWE